MKKGFSFYSIPENEDIFQAATLAASVGYDGIEPVLTGDGFLNMTTPESEILRFKSHVDNLGLEIPSFGVWLLWSNNLAADDIATREKAMDIIKRQLDMAALLGANTILVVPGYVGCDFDPSAKLVRYDHAYARSQENISKLADYAKETGVDIGVENVWNKFLLSPLEMCRFVDEIGKKEVGVYFDAGNILYVGYPDQWIEILGKRIKKVHFCDYRTAQSGLGAFVDLLAGDVNYQSVMDSLRSIGYDDYCTAEMLPQYPKFPMQAILTQKHALDQIFSL